MLPRLLCPQTLADKPETAQQVRDLARPLSGENAAQLVAALRDRRDSSALLDSIRLPTLTTGGHENALSPPEIMAQMATRIKGAHYVTLENTGHLSPLEQPEAWNDAIEHWIQSAELQHKSEALFQEPRLGFAELIAYST